jgi:hypothetical protein
MSDAMLQTWDDMAHHWDDWGPPLRPADEDLRITRAAVARWHTENPAPLVRFFLCGVTPELATMAWPFPSHLLAMDRAEGMVRVVWPGDVAGLREAVVGDWLRPGLPRHSRDVALVDGGLSFFDYPAGQHAFAAALRHVLQPRGLLVARLYAQANRRETLDEVVEAARAGQVGNFHVFKWRVAMALQPDSRVGVKLDDVWRACTSADIASPSLPQPGWSAPAVSTIRFYQGKDAYLSFPTFDEYLGVLDQGFQQIQVSFPGYELGGRCPIVTARPRT